MPRTVQEKE